MTSNSIGSANSTDSVRTDTLDARGLALSLTVNDIEKSLAWYTDVLGFTVNERYEGGGMLRAVSLKAGAVRIVIGRDDGAKGMDRVKGQGCSFQLTTTQDIDAIATRIKAAGGVLVAEPSDTPWGTRVFRVKDPDGFTFVVTSER